MRGVNLAIIMGNLGQDPDVRYTSGGAAVTSFSVATNESWTDKKSGQKQERTEWHTITTFGKLAEICGEYLHKGSQVYVEGRIQTDKYTGKDGVEKYSTKIIAREMQMIGGKSDEHKPAARKAPEASMSPERKASELQPSFPDDDIPF